MPGSPADQHKRAMYSAAAENAVEFTDARMEPAFVSGYQYP